MKRNIHGLVTVTLALVLGAGCGEEPVYETSEAEPIGENEEALSDCFVDATKELFITDLSVIQDARATGLGKWSFGHLIREMAKGRDEQEFVKIFMESWQEDQKVDGLTLKARKRMDTLVLAPWRAKSAGGRTYDLDKAPMSLLGIVYRVDLRKKFNAGEGLGEGRLVYNVHGADGRPLPYTMIFEFALPSSDGQTAESWAREFHALGALPFGPTYNTRLERLTDKFVSASALNQIRTNEIALTAAGDASPQWELRQFEIDGEGYLRPASVGLTPDIAHNNTSLLSDYVRRNQRQILDGTHTMGPRWKGKAFCGGSARIPGSNFTWRVPAVSEPVRKAFSMGTCNGCHAGETGTNFLHMFRGNGGPQTVLSNHLLQKDFPFRVEELKSLVCD